MASRGLTSFDSDSCVDVGKTGTQLTPTTFPPLAQTRCHLLPAPPRSPKRHTPLAGPQIDRLLTRQTGRLYHLFKVSNK